MAAPRCVPCASRCRFKRQARPAAQVFHHGDVPVSIGAAPQGALFGQQAKESVLTLHPAYTVGLTTSYDRSLKEEPHPVKLGRRDDYPGGWVWKSPEEARTFLSTEAFRFALPNRQPEEMSVYLLSLPSPWEECCTPYSEGVCRLLRDAPILCKV